MKARRWPLAAWRTVVSNVPSRSGSASRLSPACPAAQLLTHNMLMSPGTHNGFPLRIEVEQMEEVEVEFNADFTSRMVSKVEYKALIDTVASLDVESKLPATVPEDYASNEEFLQALHHVLMEIEIVTGTLVCPETAKRFPIKTGIPSML